MYLVSGEALRIMVLVHIVLPQQSTRDEVVYKEYKYILAPVSRAPGATKPASIQLLVRVPIAGHVAVCGRENSRTDFIV